MESKALMKVRLESTRVPYRTCSKLDATLLIGDGERGKNSKETRKHKVELRSYLRGQAHRRIMLLSRQKRMARDQLLGSLLAASLQMLRE